MPTAPDKTWSQLLDSLDDNNTGAISEEDVRAIVRFARTSYTSMGASGVDTLSWTGGPLTNPDPTDPPQYCKLRPLATYSRGENYLSPSSDGIVYAGGGGATDNVAASRITMYTWNIGLWATSLESCAVGWWYLPSGETWPDEAKRHRLGRMFTQSSWTALAPVTSASVEQVFRRTNPGYITNSVGTGFIMLNPGDTLIPVLEHYGPSPNGPSNPLLSFAFNIVTLGVVDEWTGIPDAYWNTVSDLDVDLAHPFTTPTPARLTGVPTA